MQPFEPLVGGAVASPTGSAINITMSVGSARRGAPARREDEADGPQGNDGLQQLHVSYSMRIRDEAAQISPAAWSRSAGAANSDGECMCRTA